MLNHDKNNSCMHVARASINRALSQDAY